MTPESHLIDLASLCPMWRGWNLNTKTGDLWPPDGDRPHRPEPLLELHWYFQELAAERAELRRQVATLSAQLEQHQVNNHLRVSRCTRRIEPRASGDRGPLKGGLAWSDRDGGVTDARGADVAPVPPV